MPNYGIWEFIVLVLIVFVIWYAFARALPKAIAWFINEIKKSL